MRAKNPPLGRKRTARTKLPQVGVNVIALRTGKGWSAYRLAQEAKVGTGTICQIECGKREVSLAMAARIAAALSVTVDELLTLEL